MASFRFYLRNPSGNSETGWESKGRNTGGYFRLGTTVTPQREKLPATPSQVNIVPQSADLSSETVTSKWYVRLWLRHKAG